MTAQHEVEIRGNTAPVECRSTKTSGRVLQGYGITWNSPSEPLGVQRVIERVSPSFANKQRGDTEFRGLVINYDHRNDFLLGSVPNNAVIDIDQRGLRYTVDLLDGSRSADDVYSWVKSGIVRGSSFQFIAYEDDWDFVNGSTQRTLLSGLIQNTGPTPTPAYTSSTAIALRSLASHRNASYDDVVALAAEGELRRLWTRTDNVVSQPELVTVAASSGEEARTLSTAEARAQLGGPEPGMSVKEARMRLYRQDVEANAPTLDDRYQALQRIRAEWTR